MVAAAAVVLCSGVAVAQVEPGRRSSPQVEPGGARKATPQPAKPEKPAAPAAPQVHLARSTAAECEPGCPEWIALQGRIDATSLRQLKRVLARLGERKLPILIDSPGGSVDESVAMGRLIRAKGLPAAVARTEVEPCATSDPACRKRAAAGMLNGRLAPGIAKCASACAFVLAGGLRRHVGPAAVVGVHQISSFETRFKVLRTYRVETRREWGVPVEVSKTLVSEKRIAQSTRRTETKDSDYAKVGRYLAEMGIGEEVMRAMRATPSTAMHWLTRSQLMASAMATDAADPAQVIGLRHQPAVPRATPPLPSPSPAPSTVPSAATRLLPPVISPDGRMACGADGSQSAGCVLQGFSPPADASPRPAPASPGAEAPAQPAGR